MAEFRCDCLNRFYSNAAFRRDCFWYDEEKDMGATLSFCEFHKQGIEPIEPELCYKCPKYLSSKDARDFIRKKFIVQDEVNA